MIQALQKTLGIITAACKRVGIARETHYEWMREDEEYRAKVEDVKEICLDFAEGKLFEAVKNGDSSMIRYFLSTQGKKRGYTEKQELDINANVNAKVKKVGYGKEGE